MHQIWMVGLVFCLGAELVAAQGGPPFPPPGGPPGERVTVERRTDLEFGDLIAGVDRLVPPSSADAATFRVLAAPGSVLRLEFTLPVRLADGDGGLNMEFLGGSAAWSFDDQVQGQTLFDPHAGTSVQLPPDVEILYIWLGGNLSLDVSSPSGTYRAEALLTVRVES